MYMPGEIARTVKGLDSKVDCVGCSGDTVVLFEDRFVLKISKDPARLLREKERTDWLSARIPGAKSLCFTEEDGIRYYLRTCVRGESLISERFMTDPERLIDALLRAIEVLRSLDGVPCPFRCSDNEGTDFVHGDLCLPNIFFDAQDGFSGFIDTENAGLGDRWYDYSWLLWSLNYNLKTAVWREKLLQKLGLEFDEAKYKMYIPADY